MMSGLECKCGRDPKKIGAEAKFKDIEPPMVGAALMGEDRGGGGLMQGQKGGRSRRWRRVAAAVTGANFDSILGNNPSKLIKYFRENDKNGF